jgi:hypothetical protein
MQTVSIFSIDIPRTDLSKLALKTANKLLKGLQNRLVMVTVTFPNILFLDLNFFFKLAAFGTWYYHQNNKFKN